MATENGDGQRLVTSQDPCVRVSGAAKERTHGESMDYVLESDGRMDETVLFSGGKLSITIESGGGGTLGKTKGPIEINDQGFIEEDSSSGGGPAGPDVSEDTNVDPALDFKRQLTNTDRNLDQDVVCKETISTQQEEESFLNTDDLDQMMDIVTVDQIEEDAHIKEEEEQHNMDLESSRSIGTSMTAVQEETDEKTTVLLPKVAVDAKQSSSSPSSVEAASPGRDNSLPTKLMNGMKVVKLSIPRLNTEKLWEDYSVRLSSSPPSVTVKDEPVDEEYEQAPKSCTSSPTLKDEKVETNTNKGGLKIGSVFSVVPAVETPTSPSTQLSSSHMSCAHCKKSLVMGQTAFQKKGSPALFCTTTCLTTSLPTSGGYAKICVNCQRVIFRPQNIILAPDAEGAMKEFCGENCLTSFFYNKNKNISSSTKTDSTHEPSQTAGQSFLCSMCTRNCVQQSKHEVILGSQVHVLCSDVCFSRFRTFNNLSMAGCASCSSICHSKPLLLKLGEGSKTVCNRKCLMTYKAKTKISQPCTICRTSRLLEDMIDNQNNDDTVNLFCSSSCVMAFKVQTVSSSGAQVNCDSCGKEAVPAYHLAMSDTTMRNFCTLPCIMLFRERLKTSKLNALTKLPNEAAQIIAVTTAAQPKRDVPKKQPKPKLSCSQCKRTINSQPEVIQVKDKMVFVCSVKCSHKYKEDNSVISLCDYCKMEKITREIKRINDRDCYFCSDGCKLLFRHKQNKSWGKHCNSCVYCRCVSKKLVTAQYGGSTEEFCSEECRSKYTMLFCHVAKCDTCGCKGVLPESLAIVGDVKHFCSMKCLLQFCIHKVASQDEVVKGEATPVIANVVSLAGPPTGKSNASERTAEQSTASDVQSKKSGHISVQTETVKPHQPPLPAPKILRNKALLCRPMVEHKEVTCKVETADVESQTESIYPSTIILPVPVPVYVPVPMSMYSQCTPNTVGLPLPLPVPMFLPVTLDSAERLMETIQEIKETIPSDPYEAELILMAEMLAEQDENNIEERQKAKVVQKKTERFEAPAADERASNYSDDLDPDDLASFLNSWEETSSDTCLRLSSQPNAPEAMAGEPPPRPPSPAMDIEADFTVETLERMAQLREWAQYSPSPPPASSRRKQVLPRSRVKKRGRKSSRFLKAAEARSKRGSSNQSAAEDVPQLKSQYGVDAWKRWIQWRQTQPDLKKPSYGSRPIELKEDILQCTTAELSHGLCCFITEVKRPNGEHYSPDSLFYLCLGIQQYLFENSRMENIFMDHFYSKFSTRFTNLLRGFKPSIMASGYIHSRVEEDFLWECKQLGAYSPTVLLNTLVFFCCKYFGFTTVEQHRQLSFAHVMRCTKTSPDNTKTTVLRFYPPICTNEADPGPVVPAKKRRGEEEVETREDVLEMMENTKNPLRCPVRLYEFYLSKCSESVKQRTDLFYLLPERCCVPNSPLWFSFAPLEESVMEAMLVRILTVRELHLQTGKDGETEQSTPTESPVENDDGDSE